MEFEGAQTVQAIEMVCLEFVAATSRTVGAQGSVDVGKTEMVQMEFMIVKKGP